MRWGIKIACVALCLLGGVNQAHALKISPLSLEIVASNSTTTLNLESDSPKPATVQIRVMRWTQVGGEDVLEPTSDLVASPPFATLQAKTNYTIRIVRQAEGGSAGEQAYRLLVDQLPDITGGSGAVIGLTLRHSVPVFVRPAGQSAARLSWRVERDGSGLVVTATNTGDRTARLTNLRLAAGKSKMSVQAGLAGYVLPGQSRTWRKSAPKDFSGGR